MSFGTGTEKQREITASVNETTLAANTTSDLFKQVNLGQIAKVISVSDKVYYKVHLLDDNIIVNAVLGKAINEFQASGVPDVGHFVYVSHKKDYTFCKIEYKITEEIDPELTKRTEDNGTIKFRFDNIPLNNEEKVEDAYSKIKTAIDKVFEALHLKPAVRG